MWVVHNRLVHELDQVINAERVMTWFTHGPPIPVLYIILIKEYLFYVLYLSPYRFKYSWARTCSLSFFSVLFTLKPKSPFHDYQHGETANVWDVKFIDFESTIGLFFVQLFWKFFVNTSINHSKCCYFPLLQTKNFKKDNTCIYSASQKNLTPFH